MTGTQFRDIRNKLLFTQREMALLLGVSVKTVSRVENSSRAVEKERALAVLALKIIQATKKRENQYGKENVEAQAQTAKEKEQIEDRDANIDI
jgi:transcriptional regulator with XRE-family HTH domain